MLIVIDGYNLLKSVLGKHYITQDERKAFIKRLSLYAHKRNHTVVIVFDGFEQEYLIRAQEERTDSFIQVVYSGDQGTADDYIKDFLDKVRTREALLISRDRELIKYAVELGIPSLGGVLFYKIISIRNSKRELYKTLPGENIVKTSVSTDPETDMLMKEYLVVSKVPELKDTITEHRGPSCSDRYQKGKALSKPEKKLWNLLKKL